LDHVDQHGATLGDSKGQRGEKLRQSRSIFARQMLFFSFCSRTPKVLGEIRMHEGSIQKLRL
jgi:hypothetical protein